MVPEPQDVLAEAARHALSELLKWYPDQNVGDGLRNQVYAHIDALALRAALVRTPETLDVERLREMSTRRLADALAAGNPWFSMTRDRWLAMAAGLQDHLDAATPSPAPPEGSLGVATKDGVRWWTAVADTIPPSPAPDPGAGLGAMARDLADVVRRAPDAFCDLSGARHADLVERRVILAALAPSAEPPETET